MLLAMELEEEDWVDFFGELLEPFDTCASTRTDGATTTFDTAECTGEDDDLDEDDALAILMWFDIRTIACGLQDGDDELCTEMEDGPFVPFFLFEDREVFEAGDGWEEASCYDEDDTYEDCDVVYDMLKAVYFSAATAEDLETMGLTDEGVSAMLDEYETNVTYADTLAELAELFGEEDETWADLDMGFFEMFCDADVDAMLESAGDDFGRDEIDIFSTYLEDLGDFDDGDENDDLGFLSLFGCESDFGTSSFDLFGDITSLIDDALLDDSVFGWTATCDPLLAAGVAGLLEGALSGCALCDTTEGIFG